MSTETVDWHGEGVEKEGSYGHRWFSQEGNRDVSFGASVALRPWGSGKEPLVGPVVSDLEKGCGICMRSLDITTT